MKKHLYLGQIGDNPHCHTYATVTIEDGALSISGVIGPRANGDAWGGCGQIDGELRAAVERGDIADAPSWLPQLLDIWRQWHMNHMRAGCEHQRDAEWNKRPIDPSRPLNYYIGRTWNMLVCVTRKEHPEGLLSEPCPVCGYKYGSAWLREELPADVITFLESLPETDKLPKCWQ